MAKKRSKKPIIISSIFSFLIGFVFSAIAVIYLTIPDSFTIPTTQKFDSGVVVSGELDIATIKSQDLSIHFLELGNKYAGDCTLIKVGNTEVLIDAGSRVNSVPVIKNYLDQYIEDGTIEYVIVTHAHRDHIAGFGTSENTKSIFDSYDVENVIQFVYHTSSTIVYNNYCREIDELKSRCHTTVYNARQCIEETDGAQRIYNLSTDVKLEILDQKYYYEAASDENNNSVCCQVVQNNKYYLFTGDLESDGEESLVNRNTLHQVELYKAGHHGSKTSSSATLLNVIKPKNVCVCCCAGSSEYTTNNDNQFPTQDFIDRVAQYGTARVFVTTLCVDYKACKFESMNGNIVVYCNRDDTTVTVACSNNGTLLKDTDWFKSNRRTPTAWIV